MTIELVVHDHCFSADTYQAILQRLKEQFMQSRVEIISYDENIDRMNALGINILPVWLVNNKVVSTNPFHYESILQDILSIIHEDESNNISYHSNAERISKH